jgi:hypothetical protein
VASLTVIEHSLTDLGSHHAGLASSIAAAAREAGWQVLVAANRSFGVRNADNVDLPVESVFRGTIYDNGSLLAGLDRRNRWNLPVPGVKSRPRRRWIRPWLGRITGSPERRWNTAASQFSADCQTLFGDQPFDNTDQVLVATASEVELAGLCRFLSCNPATICGTWNLLFHFNLLDGRPPEYPHQFVRLQMVRERVLHALRMVPYHRLRLFATTGQLADQYNRLGAAKFDALEWPVSSRFAPHSGNPDAGANSISGRGKPRPLRVVMPGPVRKEKGQADYLEPLLAQLNESHLVNGKLQFVLQATRRPWFQRRKLRVGSSFPRGNPHLAVEIQPHPLPPDDYVRLVNSADVGLLMYDQRAYFSRRAGVLCELLSLGRPVIVSAGTWLAEQLEDYRSEWAGSVARGALATRTLKTTDLTVDSRNLPHAGGALTFDGGHHPIGLSWPALAGESGFVVQCEWQRPVLPGTWCRLQLPDQADALSVIAGVRATDAGLAAFVRGAPRDGQFRLRITNAFHEESAGIRNLRITMLDQRAADLPLSRVGISVFNTDELAAAVREMETHYRHYRRSAEVWSGEWFERHDPRTVFRRLAGMETGTGQLAMG